MIIYRLTNVINGKMYIGQTSYTLRTRLWYHRRTNSLLAQAIRKYDLEHFNQEILLYVDSIDELNYYEEILINKLNTVAPNGYNLQSGGKNATHHEETKAKIGAASIGRNVGRKHTFETRTQMSASRKGKGSHWFGKQLSPKHVEKIAATRRGKSLSAEHKAKISKGLKNCARYNG